MNKELLRVFNMILPFKGQKKTSYNLDADDQFIIFNYWRIYDLKKLKIPVDRFKKIAVNYSVVAGVDIHNACEQICKKINVE